MKKAIILFLIPLLSLANFYPGEITLKNGNTLEGFIEIPEYPDDAKIKFRKSKKGKTEKFSIEEVKSFSLFKNKNEIQEFTTIYLARPRLFNLEKIKIDSKKSWVRVIKKGNISIYAAYYAYNPGTKTGGGGIYYVQRENEEFALYLEEFGGGGLTYTVNGFKNFKRFIDLYFKDSCPNLVNSLNKEDINNKGISYLVDLYTINCK